MLGTATATWKCLNIKFTVKCSDRVFHVTVADANIRSLKNHLQSLVFVPQASKIWTLLDDPICTKFLSFWEKASSYFWQSVDAILDFSSKNNCLMQNY